MEDPSGAAKAAPFPNKQHQDVSQSVTTSPPQNTSRPLSRAATLQLRLVPVGEFHEHIFQVWHQRANFLDMDAGVFQLALQFRWRDLVVHQGADGAAKNGGAA